MRPLAPLNLTKYQKEKKDNYDTRQIIAVGLDIQFPPEKLEELKLLLPEDIMFPYDSVPRASKYGIYFNESSVIPTEWKLEVVRRKKIMHDWYTKYADKKLIVTCDKMYVDSFKNIFIMSGKFEKDDFMFILANLTDGNRPFFHKTNVRRGNYGKGIVIPPITFDATAYIHYYK